MALTARLGIAPIGWSNDDLPQLGGDTLLETCLRESREAGYLGVETGGKFPRSSAQLAPLLAEHGLQLASGWYSGKLLDSDIDSEKSRALEQLSLFRDCGAAVLAYGETSGTIQNRQSVPMTRRRVLTDSDIAAYGQKLTAFAEYCADFGVPLAFHQHIGTVIESEHDLDRLLAATGPAVGLLYDTGHLAFARIDVFRVIDKYGSRITHVHAKDVRREILLGVKPEQESFLEAVLRGVFTVPGDGMIDFGAIALRLADVGYEGWFVVEAEQDPVKAPPLEYARLGHRSLTVALHAAGYSIEGGLG